MFKIEGVYLQLIKQLSMLWSKSNALISNNSWISRRELQMYQQNYYLHCIAKTQSHKITDS
jgi:hypothetical protein